jgi:AhpD family alkylhydroperoxidase
MTEKSLIELVKMRASQINGCAYGLHVHSKDARHGGETEQRLYLLDAWHESSLHTERASMGASRRMPAPAPARPRLPTTADRSAPRGRQRTGIGLKGKALIALVVLTRGANIRRKVFERAFARAIRQAG